MACDTVNPSFIGARCVTCGQQIEPPVRRPGEPRTKKLAIKDAVHAYEGKYYCGLHCPQHGPALFEALEREAIKREENQP